MERTPYLALSSLRVWACLTIGVLLLGTVAAVASCATHAGDHRVDYYNKGHTTASGERFNKDGFTCAVRYRYMLYHWYRFEANGRVVYAYANDIIGPAGRAKGRNYELSEGAFRRLIPAKADPNDWGHVEAVVWRVN